MVNIKSLGAWLAAVTTALAFTDVSVKQNSAYVSAQADTAYGSAATVAAWRFTPVASV